ncbi:MAG TPA: lytic transglycosylase domain-containing protein [Thermoanaerobaculia bacterium]|nr:lytic transglycosylase domain-containing protein [Thermoanaerobaculia bacterium]
MNRKPAIESLSLRVARLRKAAERHRVFRVLGARGAATIALGAALSFGGMSDVLSHVHFTVEKDLDSVQVVRRSGTEESIVAELAGFAGNTVFKLSQVLPDRLVSRELSLFDPAWMPLDGESRLKGSSQVASNEPRDVFFEEMARINDAIRREFFRTEIPFGKLIHEKAEKYDVDPSLVAAVIEQESRFKTRARSHVGARGLMQLMPRTGHWMGARDLYDPEQNVDAGVKYIKYLQKTFDGNMTNTLAAYNAGEGNVRRYRGVPPFRETRNYVKKVMQNYDRRTKQLKAFELERSGGGPPPEVDGSVALR